MGKEFWKNQVKQLIALTGGPVAMVTTLDPTAAATFWYFTQPKPQRAVIVLQNNHKTWPMQLRTMQIFVLQKLHCNVPSRYAFFLSKWKITWYGGQPWSISITLHCSGDMHKTPSYWGSWKGVRSVLCGGLARTELPPPSSYIFISNLTSRWSEWK